LLCQIVKQTDRVWIWQGRYWNSQLFCSRAIICYSEGAPRPRAV